MYEDPKNKDQLDRFQDTMESGVMPEDTRQEAEDDPQDADESNEPDTPEDEQA